MIAFFDLPACPDGWTELAAAQGRYLVGLPPGGTIGATVGTALSDQESREVGQHTHTATETPHSHGLNESHGQGAYHPNAAFVHWPAGASSNYWGAMSGTYDAGGSVTVASAGSVAGTNAPYVQFRICRKD